MQLMPLRFFLSLLAITPLSAHAGIQSAMDPKGQQAAQIADIMWVLFAGGGLIFVVVMIAVGIALFGSPAQRAVLGQRKLIIGGGILFPLVTLSALLVYSFSSRAVQAHDGASVTRVVVTGELWWWRVHYLDANGDTITETANEIRIPAGQPVDLLLRSQDVIHSFWVPNLAGKIDMIPGHDNRLRLQAGAPGIFRGQCAEYCGAQHAKMAFYVIATPPAEFDAWLDGQKRAAREPDDKLLLQGRQLFLENRCGQCHAVRGTKANGELGPDLTHVGGRHSIAAGILPNNQGTIAGWIVAGQSIKPGNRMPSYANFSGDELRALAAYLESLK